MNKRSRYCVCAHARLARRRLYRFIYKNGRIRYLRLFVAGCILIALFAWGYPYILCWYTGKPAISEMGQYGDVYGGLNTLFTGFAFIGLIITILLQRQEMKDTREEFREQTSQFEMQTKLLKSQIDEQKHFNDEQLKLAVNQHRAGDIYRRIDLMQKCLAEIRFFNYEVETDFRATGVVYQDKLEKTYSGQDAAMMIYIYLAQFAKYIASEDDLDSMQMAKLKYNLDSVSGSMCYLRAWFLSVYTTLNDVDRWFDEAEKRKFFCLILGGQSAACQWLLSLYQAEYSCEKAFSMAEKEGIVPFGNLFHGLDSQYILNCLAMIDLYDVPLNEINEKYIEYY